MSIINLLIVLLFSTTITGNPLADNNGHQSVDDVSQWSSVAEVDESSMMQMLNSIMEMIRSQLSGWIYGARSNDDVEVDSSNRGFMSMIHGLFSRISNMAMDMMGQMRRMGDKSTKDRLEDSSSSSSESDSTTGSTNSSTLATRLRNQMENTKDRIKDAWNNLMKKYNSTIGSSSSAMTMASNLQNDNYHLIDDESKANRNLRSDNRRVIRSLDNIDSDGDGQFEIVKSSYINSVEPKVFDKMVDQLSKKSDLQGRSKQFDSLIASPSDEDSSQSRNLFDRMRGAMDNARSKFFGAIGKFMNGTMMVNDPDDDSINSTENDPKNWWQMFKPKPTNPSKIPEREPSNPRDLIPTKSNYPSSMIPKDITKIRNNYPDLHSIPSSYKPQVDWTIKSHPKIIPTEVDLDSGDIDKSSRTTIEFMDKFKGEIERVKSSVEPSTNDNVEMAMAKMANWGLFIRSISESKNLDDFWGKITQQVN